jgi:transposase
MSMTSKNTADPVTELRRYTADADHARCLDRRRLLLELRAQGWTQEALAAELGVHRNQVVRWLAYGERKRSA